MEPVLSLLLQNTPLGSVLLTRGAPMATESKQLCTLPGRGKYPETRRSRTCHTSWPNLPQRCKCPSSCCSHCLTWKWRRPESDRWGASIVWVEFLSPQLPADPLATPPATPPPAPTNVAEGCHTPSETSVGHCGDDFISVSVGRVTNQTCVLGTQELVGMRDFWWQTRMVEQVWWSCSTGNDVGCIGWKSLQ